MVVLHHTDTLLGLSFRHQTRQILGLLSDTIVRQTILLLQYQ